MDEATEEIAQGCATIRHFPPNTYLVETNCNLATAELDKIRLAYRSILKAGDNLVVAISNTCNLAEECTRFLLEVQRWVTDRDGLFVLVPSKQLKHKFREYGLENYFSQCNSIDEALTVIEQSERRNTSTR